MQGPSAAQTPSLKAEDFPDLAASSSRPPAWGKKPHLPKVDEVTAQAHYVLVCWSSALTLTYALCRHLVRDAAIATLPYHLGRLRATIRDLLSP